MPEMDQHAGQTQGAHFLQQVPGYVLDLELALRVAIEAGDDIMQHS
jgi:hypothetical protein